MDNQWSVVVIIVPVYFVCVLFMLKFMFCVRSISASYRKAGRKTELKKKDVNSFV